MVSHVSIKIGLAVETFVAHGANMEFGFCTEVAKFMVFQVCIGSRDLPTNAALEDIDMIFVVNKMVAVLDGIHESLTASQTIEETLRINMDLLVLEQLQPVT